MTPSDDVTPATQALRDACRKGCFSGGCGTCWTSGCDHHGPISAEPSLTEKAWDLIKWAGNPGTADEEWAAVAAPTLRAVLAEARAASQQEIERLRAALLAIGSEGCTIGGKGTDCPEEFGDDEDSWCDACIACAALGEKS